MGDAAVIDALRARLTSAGARFIIDESCKRFREPALADALSVWRQKAGAGPAPRRSDMTPQVMRHFLKRVALAERFADADGRVRYRLRITGQEFSEAYTEMSGKFVDEVVSAKYRPRWTAILESVLAYGAPFRGIGVPEAFHRDHSVIEMLFAPLLDDDGVPCFVLSVASFERGRAWAEVEREEARFAEQPSP